MNSEIKYFIIVLWIMIIVSWLISGEIFIDLAFEIPDFFFVDDLIISAILKLESLKLLLIDTNYFSLLRELIHEWTGLPG